MGVGVLTLDNLTKTFATAKGQLTVVDQVSLEVRGAEFFTMLGPSGCGKTTTLRMIAGLESATGGRLLIDGRDFTRYPVSQRNIGMVFQSYALFPHISVYENAAYGLRIRGRTGPGLKEKVTGILRLLGLDALAERYPADLSGGQQQRVSIARALVYDPGILLLDEPLANLDAKLRVEMREEIRRIQKELGIMSIYVTHDQEEAMSVSDRLAVFNHGRLMQVGEPSAVYAAPTSLFVADFLGKANFFPARITMRDRTGVRVALSSGTELGTGASCEVRPDEANQIPTGFDAVVMFRPQHLHIRPASEGQLPCEVTRIQFLGNFTRYTVECRDCARSVTIEATRPISGIEEGGTASIGIEPADARVFVRRGS